MSLRKEQFFCVASQRGKKKNSSSKSKSKNVTKRVREERADAFRRGVNTVLVLVFIGLFAYGGYSIWNFLGRPGLPEKPGMDNNARVKLYFYDNAVTYLVPVNRYITLEPGETITARAIKEFSIGPNDSYLARVYPANIPIPGVLVNGEVAIVDLPLEITAHLGGTMREKDLLNALSLTVEAAGECESVRILIAGEPQDATPEGYDLTEPLKPPEYFNHVPDFGLQGDSKWITTWFLDSSARYLVPLAIEVPAQVEDASAAIERLLKDPPQLSYPPPSRVSPSGYSLERLIVESDVATVDISVPDSRTAFADHDVNLFRRAVYLTLKACCGITDIRIKINGRDLVDYSRFGILLPVANEDSWNVESQVPVQDFDQELNTEGGA